MPKYAAVFAACVTLALSTAAPAHGPSPVGEPGNRAAVNRTIEVTMQEGEGRMTFEPGEITLRRGDTVRFVVRNAGVLDHELVIDTLDGNQRHRVQMERSPVMEHADPNAVQVAPEKSGEIVWRFRNSGIFEYACLIPGHYESGMHGRINVR